MVYMFMYGMDEERNGKKGVVQSATTLQRGFRIESFRVPEFKIIRLSFNEANCNIIKYLFPVWSCGLLLQLESVCFAR